jgi:hypothetical protein
MVNKAWRSRQVRANCLVSDIVTISDEAYAMVVSGSNLLYWILKIKAKNEQSTKATALAENDGDEENEDDKDDENDKASEKVDAEAYFKLHLELTELKTNDDTADDWKSWDYAFKTYIAVSENPVEITTITTNSKKAASSSKQIPRGIVFEKWADSM